MKEGTDSSPVTVTDEQAAGILQAVRDLDWRQEIEKREGVTREQAGTYEALKPSGSVRDFHADTSDGKPFCRCRRVRFPRKLRELPGDFREVGEGDLRSRLEAYRRLTAEEASDAVTLEAAQRFLEATRPSRAASELVVSVQNEIARTEAELAAIQRRLADLSDSLLVAENRKKAADADVEKHLEGRTPEWRARVEALSATFESRCRPDPPSPSPGLHTLEDIRRAAAGDVGSPVAFAGSPAGPLRLKVNS